MNQLLFKLTEGVLLTPNVDHMMTLQEDPEFYRIYQEAEYVVLDSQVIAFVMKYFLRTPVPEKISGSDFFPAFCRYHKDDPEIKIFLLGGKPGAPEKAMENINSRIGHDIIIGAHSPSMGFEKNPDECAVIVDMINSSGATVLAVGVGAPKQEKWIYNYKAMLKGVKIFMGIGATIEFEAGFVERAPSWMSSAGLEWLYRMLQEPGRLWRRYLVRDIPFFWLVFKQKLGKYRNPFA
jgi:exopolysaccharide biosynthesis WecB/TagA/CpsF family protein